MAAFPLRVLVCDDELMARRRIVRLLGTLGDIEAIFEAGNGDEVLATLAADEVDLALLDVSMPGRSGLETVLAMPEDRPYVIFVTAHPEHAVAAFEVGAVDYLMKPVDEVRLGKAVERARAFLDRALAPPAARLQKLAIATRDGAELVAPAEITHATFDGALVTIFTRTRAILSDDTLQDLEGKLAAAGPFERVHRRAVVNLEHVDKLESVDSGGYVACLSGGKRVDVSRQSARKLRRRLGLR